MNRSQFNQSNAISFSDFLNRANQIELKNQRAFDIESQADAAFASAFWFKGRPQLMFQGMPDYSKDIAAYMKGYTGKKYIFIAEASDHDQKTLVKHAIKILGSLRKDNPGAKILLANEFSVVSNTSTLPIRFSGHKRQGFDTFDSYDLLEEAADQLGFDILALDDYSFVQTNPDTYFAKVGPAYIAINKTDPRIKQIADDFGYDPAEGSRVLFAYSHYFLVSNTYGVELRNQQWVSYIKALQPFYDIIVVYGGSGHLRISGFANSVPLMLNPTRAVTISLNSKEELAPFVQEHYQTRKNIQEKFEAKSDSISEPEYFDDGKGNEDLSDTADHKINFSKPHYRRENGVVFGNWYRQHVRNQEAFNNYQQQYAAFEKLVGKSPLHYPKWLTYDVYLD